METLGADLQAVLPDTNASDRCVSMSRGSAREEAFVPRGPGHVFSEASGLVGTRGGVPAQRRLQACVGRGEAAR
jgi:hypothetical protein